MWEDKNIEMKADKIPNERTLLKITLISAFVWILTFTAQSQNGQPVVTYAVQHPDDVKQGEAFHVDVKFNAEPPWYIYAPTGNNAAQGMIETKVVFRLPEGITRVGKIKLPEPNYKNGHEVYEGNITMSQGLLASTSLKPGTYEIKGKITWQACKDDLCLPPITEEIVVAINIK